MLFAKQSHRDQLLTKSLIELKDNSIVACSSSLNLTLASFSSIEKWLESPCNLDLGLLVQ